MVRKAVHRKEKNETKTKHDPYPPCGTEQQLSLEIINPIRFYYNVFIDF
jgi:hypothetical protein